MAGELKAKSTAPAESGKALAEKYEARLVLITDKLQQRTAEDRQKVKHYLDVLGVNIDVLKSTDQAQSIKDLSKQSEAIIKKLEAAVDLVAPKKGKAKKLGEIPATVQEAAKPAEVSAFDELLEKPPEDLSGYQIQDQQADVQAAWEKKKKELEAKKIADEAQAAAEAKANEGKYVTAEGEIGAELVRFQKEIPSELAGLLLLENTRPTGKEIVAGKTMKNGELTLVNGKLVLETGEADLAVNEVYQNLDGSWTIDAGKYEFRTEGGVVAEAAPAEPEKAWYDVSDEEMGKPEKAEATPKPKIPETTKPNLPPGGILPVEEPGTTEITDEGPVGVPENAVKLDIRSNINVAKMRHDGMSNTEIAKNLKLLSSAELKKNTAVTKAIESLTGKIAANGNIDAEIKVLAKELGLPDSEVQKLHGTIMAEMDRDARGKMPRDSKKWAVTKWLTKTAAWIGFGVMAASGGTLAVPAVMFARGLDSVRAKMGGDRRYKEAMTKTMGEVSVEGSALNKKLNNELISRLALLKQEQVNSSEMLSQLPAAYEAIRDAEDSNERESRIGANDRVLESLGENIYMSCYDYYKSNNSELGDAELEALATEAKFKFIQEEKGKRSKVMNKVINRTFDERVDWLVDKTVPTFRDMLKGGGLTENESQWHSGAVSIGMGAAMRGMGSFAALHAGAFLMGGMGGEWAGRKMFGKELEMITTADLQKLDRDPSSEQVLRTIGKIESQINDPAFAEHYPSEFEALQKWMDTFDEQVLTKMDNAADKQAFTEDRSTGITNWLAREKDQKDKITLSRWLGRWLLVGLVSQIDTSPEHKPPVEKHNPPPPPVKFPTLEGHITPGHGISTQLEDMVKNGIKDGKITEQNAQHFIDQSKLALEHARQAGDITDEVFNKIQERIAHGATLQDRLLASVDARGLDLRDFDMQKAGDALHINLEKGSIDFVNRGDIVHHAPIYEAPHAYVTEANSVGFPPETPQEVVDYNLGRSAELQKEIDALQQAKSEFPVGEQAPFDKEIAKLQFDQTHPAALNLPSAETIHHAQVFNQLIDQVKELSGSHNIEISAKPDVLDVLAKRGFHIQTSSGGTSEFIAGNNHFQITEGVEKIGFEQHGDIINLIQTTKDQIITVPINADNVAGTAIIEDKGWFS